MQLTVTEHNSWEGETFNYILNNISDELATKIENFCEKYSCSQIPATYEVKRNTEHTRDSIKVLNENSNNGYMWLYGFYKLPENPNFENDTLFYKGGSLIRDEEKKENKKD